MATSALALLGTILFLSACISPAGHEPACGDNFQPRPLAHGVPYRLTLVVYSNDGLFESHQLDFDP